MAKLSREPNPEHLGAQTPDIITIPQGTELSRLYRRGGAHPTPWNAMRPFGPTDARFDHHERNAYGEPHEQERRILYAATDVETVLAEVFQEDRTVDLKLDRPWLASWIVTRDIRLLNLSGTFPLLAGGSMKLMSGPRSHSRNWSRGFYECYPDIEGLYYDPQFVASRSDACGTAYVGAAVLYNPDTRASSMTNRPIVALYERVLDDTPFPAEPHSDRPLDDIQLFESIRNACAAIGYTLS